MALGRTGSDRPGRHRPHRSRSPAPPPAPGRLPTMEPARRSAADASPIRAGRRRRRVGRGHRGRARPARRRPGRGRGRRPRGHARAQGAVRAVEGRHRRGRCRCTSTTSCATPASIGASDLHLTTGLPPCIRVQRCHPAHRGLDKLNNETIRDMVFGVLPQTLRERFEAEKELDTSHSIVDVGRFRLNVFQQRGHGGRRAAVDPARDPDLRDARASPSRSGPSPRCATGSCS